MYVQDEYEVVKYPKLHHVKIDQVDIIYHNLHVSCLPMMRHATRHSLQQVMKLHWNLKSLSQSGTIYEFLVEEHIVKSLYNLPDRNNDYTC